MDVILDRSQQIDLLQKMHWANENITLKFSTEQISHNIFRIIGKKYKDNNEIFNGSYGLYDDALILKSDIWDGDYRLYELSVDKVGYLTGKAIFSSRKKLDMSIILQGIQNY